MDLQGVGADNVYGALGSFRAQVAVHVADDDALLAHYVANDAKAFDGFFIFHGDGFTADGHGDSEPLGQFRQIGVNGFGEIGAAGNGVNHKGKGDFFAEEGRSGVDVFERQFRQGVVGQKHVFKECAASVFRL